MVFSEPFWYKNALMRSGTLSDRLIDKLCSYFFNNKRFHFFSERVQAQSLLAFPPSGQRGRAEDSGLF